MRKLDRPALAKDASDRLVSLTQKVVEAADLRTKAKQLWDDRSSSGVGAAAFQTIRDTLEQMAAGRARCMYCEDSAGTDIEHFQPKALFPALAFTWSNYLLACSYCNSNLTMRHHPSQPVPSAVQHVLRRGLWASLLALVLILGPKAAQAQASGPRAQPTASTSSSIRCFSTSLRPTQLTRSAKVGPAPPPARCAASRRRRPSGRSWRA